jgi:hypothetical protein
MKDLLKMDTKNLLFLLLMYKLFKNEEMKNKVKIALHFKSFQKGTQSYNDELERFNLL